MNKDAAARPAPRTAAVGFPESTLRLLGLGGPAAEIYRLLLEQPLLDSTTIATQMGCTVDEVEAGLTELNRNALIRPSQTSPGRWRATSPEVALPTLVEGIEADLHARRADLAGLRSEVAGMVARYRSHQAELHSGEFEQLHDHDAVVGRIEELGRSAEQEILAIIPRRPSPQGMADSRLSDADVLGRGVHLRTLHLTAHLDDDLFLSHLAEFTRLGGEARVLPTLPVRMNLYDRRLAVVAVDPDEPGAGAVVIQAPGILSALTALFDLCWQEATPTATSQGRAAAGVITPTERQVLRLLGRGLKDETVARHLGISVRTARRLIAQLTTRADAGSRFELALNARELGWF